ncbi:MAG: Ig-like domain-containing protein, partial [Planctomycetota bacterium]
MAIQPAAQQTQMIEDTGSTLLIRAEDARFAERELTVTITGPPRKGLLNVLAGRSPLEVTFTPDEDFAGTDSFTFVVRNPDGAESAPTRVVLTVEAVNDAPEPQPIGAVTVTEDSTSQLTLTGNDAENDPADLEVQITTLPALGTLSLTAGSAPLEVVYAPDPNASGSDFFEFVLIDRDGLASEPQRVLLEVGAVNDAPVAQPLTAQGPEDTPLDLVL